MKLSSSFILMILPYQQNGIEFINGIASARIGHGTASARTYDPGASVGRIVSRRIWMKASISRRSGARARLMLRKTFKMLRTLLFNVANLVRATSNE
jgi:hypothetical protein